MPAPRNRRTPFAPLPGPAALTGLGVLLSALVGLVGLAGPASAQDAGTPRWRWPVDGAHRVLRPFEAPAGPYGPGHRGIDIAAEAGTPVPVRAAGAGTVVFAGDVAGRPVVVVAHGSVRSDLDLRTSYEPVTPSVVVGEIVAPGDVLGTLTTWSDHCPAGQPCLHLGLRRGSTDYVDPMSLFRGAVRLLPVGPPVQRDDSPPAPPPVPAEPPRVITVAGSSAPTPTATATRAAAAPATAASSTTAPRPPDHHPTRDTSSALMAAGLAAGGVLGVRRTRRALHR